MPDGFSKLESVTGVPGQNFQENPQAFGIDVPMWRQLKQAGADRVLIPYADAAAESVATLFSVSR